MLTCEWWLWPFFYYKYLVKAILLMLSTPANLSNISNMQIYWNCLFMTSSYISWIGSFLWLLQYVPTELFLFVSSINFSNSVLSSSLSSFYTSMTYNTYNNFHSCADDNILHSLLTFLNHLLSSYNLYTSHKTYTDSLNRYFESIF